MQYISKIKNTYKENREYFAPLHLGTSWSLSKYYTNNIVIYTLQY